MWTAAAAANPAASDDPNNADAVEPDAEVSFVTKDLAPVLPKAKLAAVVALDDVLMRVRDASNWRGGSGVRYPALPNTPADASRQSHLKLNYPPEHTLPRPHPRFHPPSLPHNLPPLPHNN